MLLVGALIPLGQVQHNVRRITAHPPDPPLRASEPTSAYQRSLPIVLRQAIVAWNWRFSVRDEIKAQEESLGGGVASTIPTHIVIADYMPSFDRTLAASNGEQMTRLPQTTETAEVRMSHHRLVIIVSMPTLARV